jgi:hypothetical protein
VQFHAQLLGCALAPGLGLGLLLRVAQGCGLRPFVNVIV